MTAAENLIEISDISHTYTVRDRWLRKRDIHAVENVSLVLPKGEVLGIVGESGSGKTTLLKIMLGLVKPTKGEACLFGRPVYDWSRKALSKRVQYVFQDPSGSLNPRRTIGEIIRHPLDIHRHGATEDRDREVKELLERVGLPGRTFTSLPKQLSGGQRQRVAIARALALQPDILICDEPTSALDVSVQAQILNLLLDLRQQFNLSYIFVSHNLSVVEYISTSVAVLYEGKVVETGSPDKIFKNPNHPYTKRLLSSVMTLAPGLGIPPVLL